MKSVKMLRFVIITLSLLLFVTNVIQAAEADITENTATEAPKEFPADGFSQATPVSVSDSEAPKEPLSDGVSEAKPSTLEMDALAAERNGTALHKHDAIHTFRDHFAHGVKNCDLLCRLFDLQEDVSVDEFEAGCFYVATAAIAQSGFQNAAANGEIAVRNINEDHNRLGFDSLVDVYSHAMATFLHKSKQLTEENAAKLSTTYVTAMQTATSRILNEEYPRSKVAIFAIAYKAFFVENDLIKEGQVEEAATAFADEWKHKYKTDGQAKSLPKPSFKEPENPIKPRDSFCKVKSEAVELFTESFRKSVRASKTLSRLFSVCDSMSPSELSRAVFYMSLYLLDTGHAKDTSVLADFMSKYVKEVRELDRPALVGVHANFVAKLLLSERILTSDRADSFATKYAEIMEIIADFIGTWDNPRASVIAIEFAWRDYLLHCKLFNASYGHKIAHYYGNEWYCQSLSGAENRTVN